MHRTFWNTLLRVCIHLYIVEDWGQKQKERNYMYLIKNSMLVEGSFPSCLIQYLLCAKGILRLIGVQTWFFSWEPFSFTLTVICDLLFWIPVSSMFSPMLLSCTIASVSCRAVNSPFCIRCYSCINLAESRQNHDCILNSKSVTFSLTQSKLIRITCSIPYSKRLE